MEAYGILEEGQLLLLSAPPAGRLGQLFTAGGREMRRIILAIDDEQIVLNVHVPSVAASLGSSGYWNQSSDREALRFPVTSALAA